MCDVISPLLVSTVAPLGEPLTSGTQFTVDPGGEYIRRTHKNSGNRLLCRHSPDEEWHDMTDEVPPGGGIFCPDGTEIKIVQSKQDE